MESNLVCYHKSDNKIGRPHSGSPICLSISRVRLQTELYDAKSHQNYNYREKKNTQVEILLVASCYRNEDKLGRFVCRFYLYPSSSRYLPTSAGELHLMIIFTSFSQINAGVLGQLVDNSFCPLYCIGIQTTGFKHKNTYASCKREVSKTTFKTDRGSRFLSAYGWRTVSCSSKQPRSQGLFPGLLSPPPSPKTAPGNEVDKQRNF